MLLLGSLLYVRERTAAFLCKVLTLTPFQGHFITGRFYQVKWRIFHHLENLNQCMLLFNH